MASRPTKGDLRIWMRRVREDLVGLNKALTADNQNQVKLFLSDALGALEEVTGLAEERYDIEIACAEFEPNPIEAGEGADEGDDEGEYDDDFDELEEGDEELDDEEEERE